MQYADGGTMTYTYSNPTTIIQQQDETNAGDGLIKTQRLLDGFGRLVEADSYNSSGQAIAVTQSYDALGRVSQTTNPSIAGDNLNYATTYTYDGLNRLTQTPQPPDGSVTSTTYSGNSSLTTDPTTLTPNLATTGSISLTLQRFASRCTNKWMNRKRAGWGEHLERESLNAPKGNHTRVYVSIDAAIVSL